MSSTFGLVLDGMAAPVFLQGDHLAEEVKLPLRVLRQGIVHDEEPVVVYQRDFLDRLIDGTGPEFASAQVGHGAGIAVEPAPARRVHQVHHLHALVVIEIALVDAPPGRSHALDRGQVGNIVIHVFKDAVPEIGEHLFHASLGLPEENGVRVLQRLLRVEHGRDAAEDDLHAPLPVLVRDLPSALHLGGEHHGYAHEIDRIVIADRFQVLVNEFHIDIIRERCSHDRRPVGRQVEGGLLR